MDCIGLIAYSQSYPMEKLPFYPRDPYNNELEKNLDRIVGLPVIVCAAGVQRSDLLAGDIVAMAYAKHVRHVALIADHPAYAGHLSIIHTDSNVGKVTEHILDQKWLRRIRRVYRP
jgi:uncharacterized protein YijF (DUF1287 family)